MEDPDNVFIDGKPLSSLRVVDLKEELKKRGIKSSGNKKLLQDLLILELSKESQISGHGHAVVPNLAFVQDNANAQSNDFVKNYLAEQAFMIEQQRREIETGMTHSDGTSHQEDMQTSNENTNDEAFDLTVKPVEKKVTVVQDVVPVKDVRQETSKSMKEVDLKVDEVIHVKEQVKAVEKQSIESTKIEETVELKVKENSKTADEKTIVATKAESLEMKVSPHDGIKSISNNKDTKNESKEPMETTLPNVKEMKEDKKEEKEDRFEISLTVNNEDSELIDSEDKSTDQSEKDDNDNDNQQQQQPLTLIEQDSTEEKENKTVKADKVVVTSMRSTRSNESAHKVKESVKETTESSSTHKLSPSASLSSSTTSITTVESRPKAVRKRRWGAPSSSGDTNTNVGISGGISSDRLKELIPDLASDVLHVLHSTNSVSCSSSGVGDSMQKVSNSNNTVICDDETNTNKNSAGRAQLVNSTDAPLSKRDIRVIRKSTSFTEDKDLSASSGVNTSLEEKPTALTRKFSSERLIQEKALDKEGDQVKEEQVLKVLSPAKNPESNILFITNLVRPFTLLQLKEVLSKSGKLVEEEFWIDKIKSKCYVTYQTQEEAIATRDSLHGQHWPTSNPKTLHVEYALKDDLERVLNAEKAGVTHNNRDEALEKKIEMSINNDKCDVVIRKERDKDGRKEKGSDENRNNSMNEERPVREWDREKIGKRGEDERGKKTTRQRSPDRTQDTKRRRHDSTRGDVPEAIDPKAQPTVAGAETESPAKLLDDLFKKTKAIPCIYWLPLTEEQMNKKEADRVEREKRRLEDRASREEARRDGRETQVGRKSPPGRNDRFSPQRRRSPPRRSPPRGGDRPFYRRSPRGRRGAGGSRRFPYRRSRSPPKFRSPPRRERGGGSPRSWKD